MVRTLLVKYNFTVNQCTKNCIFLVGFINKSLLLYFSDLSNKKNEMKVFERKLIPYSHQQNMFC